MSPLRWDVLTVGLVLALPVLALYLRGDFTIDEVVARLPWCLLAGWGAVALLRWAATPQGRPADRHTRPTKPVPDEDPTPVA
ncbi:hypothetical protein [Geodermatophilus normandii]|uniref:Uncharacterized protein n=1 Tax=Geodermatophilus normandii TaxID=1137989 RepID=A0A6P0GAW6_9ACTN|nr:hypothetical protein [Geodermatophilus normandii]NEM05332.1 hypothetical protein [Geodermatophilus normandii]